MFGETDYLRKNLNQNWTLVQNQHTRELIIARNAKHKYNNKDLSQNKKKKKERKKKKKKKNLCPLR